MAPSARKAYSDATAWMRSRVPPRRERVALATAALVAALVDGVLLMSVIGLLSPASFGVSGGRAFGSGTRTLALLGLAGLCGLWLARRFRAHRWVVAKAREPFRRPLEEDPAFAGASGALGASAGPSRTLFALRWVWLPAVGVLLAITGALTTAYFLVDAVIARFEIGWQQPVLAAANLVVAWVVLRVSAGRIAVWPLAVSVHREATTGYA
jgi:hypothetical protein